MVSVGDKAEMAVIFVTNNVHANVTEIRPFRKFEAPIAVSCFHRLLTILSCMRSNSSNPPGLWNLDVCKMPKGSAVVASW